MIPVILSLSIIIITAALLLSLVDLRGRLATLLALFLVSYAGIVLIFEGLSFFYLLTVAGVLAAESVFFLLAFALWCWQGKPMLLSSFRDWRWQDYYARYIRGQAVLITALAIALSILLALFIIGWRVPDTFQDSLIYHFPKMALWTQHRSILLPASLAQNLTDLRMITTPHNSEIGYLWVFFFSGTDRFSNLVEWVGLIISMLAIYGIGVRISGNKRASLLAALLFITYESTHWNALAANSNLLATAFLLSGLYFLLISEDEMPYLHLAFAMTALGLAYGTKESLYYLAPWLLILLAVFFFKGIRKHGGRFAAIFLGTGILSLVLFASIPFAESARVFGSPLAGVTQKVARIDSREASFTADCLVINLLRYGHDFLYPEPLPSSWAGIIAPAYSGWWGGTGQWFGQPLDGVKCSSISFTFDAQKGMGLGAIFLVVAGLASSVAAAFREKAASRRAILGLFAGFLLTASLIHPYAPSTFRYFSISLALFSILLVDLMVVLEKKRVLLSLVILLQIFSGFIFVLQVAKEAFTDLPGFRQAFAEARSHDDFSVAAGMMAPGTKVVALFPAWHSSNILAWGEGYSREVTLSSCENLARDLEAIRADYLLLITDEIAIGPATIAPCRESLPVEIYADLAERIMADYDLIYGGVEVYRHVFLYQREGVFALPAVVPSSEGVEITLLQRDQLLISPGPLARNDRVLNAGNDLYFSLRASEAIDLLPVTVLLYGEPNSAGEGIPVSVYDERGELIHSDRVIPIRWAEDRRELVLWLPMAEGLNSILIDGNGELESEVTTPLYLDEVIVRGDIVSRGISLFGPGWYGIERLSEDITYRWVSDEAAFSFTAAESGDYLLTLTGQAGPGNDYQPMTVKLIDEDGATAGVGVAGTDLTSLTFLLSLEAGEHTFTLDPDAAGLAPVPGDARVMNLLVTALALEMAP